jgi:ornithine carbamoyltransferase
VRLAYVGDGNNMARRTFSAEHIGMDVAIATPTSKAAMARP